MLAVRDVADIGRLGTVLGVWAHPDDEAFFAAGVMAAARGAGSRVVCVTATRGEVGDRSGRLTQAEVARQRSAELARALAELGVQEHVLLDYPDGGCADVDDGAAVDRLRRIIADIAPATVLTFGPDGVTGHADHVAVGRWAAAAAEGTGAVVHAVTRTPAWVEQFVTPAQTSRVFRRATPATTPVDQLSIHLQLDGELLELKQTAVSRHASQLGHVRDALGDEVFRRALAEEAFRVLPD